MKGKRRPLTLRATGMLCLYLVLSCVGVLRADHKPLTGEEQQKVDQAIERGIDYLKHSQLRDGSWSAVHGRTVYNRVGHTLLPLLALLESGVSAEDTTVQKALRWTRARVMQLDSTYDIALALLVLDRLGEAQDKQAIQSLALRLVAGQCRTGGWSYRCLKLTAQNEAALLAALEHSEEKRPIPQPLRLLTVFQNPARLLWQDPPGAPGGNEAKAILGTTDNSNTQFALLGLWAARRHASPLERTLGLAVKRFESSQNPDGTWSYGYVLGGGEQPPRARAMTTVGLLALAMRDGLRLPSSDSSEIPKKLRIVSALAALSRDIGAPTGQMSRRLLCPDLYFLWSVERVGMLYNLQKIGNKDWYRWGTEILVTNQTRTGFWPQWEYGARDNHATYGPTINTSFALLFLKRSHLLRELTDKLPYKPEELNTSIKLAIDNPQAIPRIQSSPGQGPQKP